MSSPSARSPKLGARFQEALAFASELHETQLRKGTETPYLSHLLSVAALVLEDGGDEEEAIAALLHDAVEDQGGMKTLEEIRARFGERVGAIVEGCSDSVSTPKPPWRERKAKYIEHLKTASPSVLRVSAADKLHNARSILMDYRRHGDGIWSRFKGGKDGTLWNYGELVKAFREAGGSPLAEEFALVVAEIEKAVGR
ncbi:MAG: HD domain-containing protein [Acidobacteria bacterium]|nr:HD domain-containing protein [Acidobacteriota bacterium]